MARRKNLGELLVSAGFLTSAQLEECLQISQETNKRLGEVAVEREYVTSENLYSILENQHKVPFVDLELVGANPAVVSLVGADLARRHNLAPVKKEGNVLYIAIEDPRNFRAIDDVRTVTRLDVRPMLASAGSITRYIERSYSSDAANKALMEYSEERGTGPVEVSGTIEVDVNASPIVRLVNNILDQAVSSNASDIHIEPMQGEVRVRLRIDGVLKNTLSAPLNTLNALIARIKVMGGMNIAERRAPQDGRFNVNITKSDIDVRVSIVPTVFGEKAVLRLLDRSKFLVDKSKLGFTDENMEKFNKLLKSPHGVILITGPTGSGKSTTLYTMLKEINSERDNITTVEDPVEYMMEGVNQMQVNPRAGVTFATGLRAMLRQDPDIIMVGEIRDEETVEIGIRAAITGHLVLSTIHTNDALSTIVRLQNMGIPSYLIAASLEGIVSQRLLRRICLYCKAPDTITEQEANSMGIEYSKIEGRAIYKGVGCPQCNGGYRGRIAVHEIVIIDREIRDLIQKSASLSEIQAAAVKSGMTLLKESALKLVLDGTTSIQEISTILS